MAYTVYYVNKGLHIFFESDAQSQKLHVLKSNPRIAVAIDEDYEDWNKIKGVQIIGLARFVSDKDDDNIQEIYKKKFRQLEDLGGIPQHHVFVEIVPEKIYYLDYEERFGKKSILHYEEKKKKHSLIKW